VVFYQLILPCQEKKPETSITAEKLEEFITELKIYIKEIYNPEIDFIEPADLRY